MTDNAHTDHSNDIMSGDHFQPGFIPTQGLDIMSPYSTPSAQEFSHSGDKEKDGDTLRQMLSGSGDPKGTGHHGAMPGNQQQAYMAALQQQQMGMGGGAGPMGVGPKGQGMMPPMHSVQTPHHYSTPPTHHPSMAPSGYRPYRVFSKPMMDQFKAQMYAYRCLSERKAVPEQMLQLIAGRYAQAPPTDPNRMLGNPSMSRYTPRPQSNPGTGSVDWLGSLGYGGENTSYEPVPNVTVSSSSVIPSVTNQSTTTPDLKLPQPLPPPLPAPSLPKPPSDTLAPSKSNLSVTSPSKYISPPSSKLPTPPSKITSPQQLSDYPPQHQQTPQQPQQQQQQLHPTRPQLQVRVTTLEKPQGIDPGELILEREKRLKSRISQRIEQLSLEPQEEINSRIELKGLRLLTFQKELRYDIIQLMNRETTLETALNLRAYKIPKRQTLKDATNTERLEKFHRKGVEIKRRQEHEVFLAELMTHTKDFREFHRGVQARISKLKRDVVQYHDRLEKEQKRVVKERMMKLMAEDDEGYKQLIDEQKNRRLAFLLKQTDEHIEMMRQLVMQHQGNQKRVRRDQRRKQRVLARLSSQGQGDEELNKVRIPVRCLASGLKKEGPDAPLFDDLEQFLEDNPGWEVLDSDGEGSDGEEGLSDAMETTEETEVRPSVGGESDHEDDKTVSTIRAASKRVEIDDDYVKKGSKGGESSYYSLAHSYHEEIREQPSSLEGGTLKEYQVKGLEWLVSLYNNNLNGILADEMGLGKTIQTIALFTYLMEKKGVNGPHLVVVPLCTIFNWCMEFRKWAPRILFIGYKGDPQVRKGYQHSIKAGKFNVLITTYDYVMKDKAFLSKIQWKYMIIDEGHRMKNRHCKLTQILNQYYLAPHRVLLSGTPIQNNLSELWALLNFLLPSIFKSCTSFEQWFNAPFANTGEKMELNEEETILIIRRLHKALRPFLLRRLKKEVESQLPDKVEYVVKCDMSALQKVVYKQLQQGGLVVDTNSKGKYKKQYLNNIIVQLRKLCNHPFMFDKIETSICHHLGFEGVTIPTNSSLIYRASGKFELLDRILPKFLTTNHRILLFCQMTELMTILEDYLTWKGWKDRYLRLDGHTKADDRFLLLEEFNRPGSTYFIFLLSTRAGGLGLNLQSADTVIIFDLDWNPHQDLQAEARAHRIGQSNEVRVLRLITTNSVEEKILATAKFKLNVDVKVIQAGMFDNKSTSRERRDFLVTLLEDERIEEEEDPIPDDETLNRMIARSEEEFQLFQRMDGERITRDSMDELLRHSSRLMQEDELPDYLLRDTAELIDLSDDNEDQQGKGYRVKDKVNYCEIMSEKKWLKTLNDPLDDQDDSPVKSKKRKAGDSSNEGTPPPKKQRKRQGGRGKISMDLIREMMKIWQEVVYYEDDDGRRLSDIFMELPSKRELPDYYQIISEPTDLKKVKNKVLKGFYRDWEEFDQIMKVLFANVRLYNIETSRIYEDSKILEEVFLKARNDLEMGDIDSNDLLPEVQNDLDSISISTPSKAPTSSNATPKKKRGRPGRPRKVINPVESDEDDIGFI